MATVRNPRKARVTAHAADVSCISFMKDDAKDGARVACAMF
jgi:hypothetical protein